MTNSQIVRNRLSLIATGAIITVFAAACIVGAILFIYGVYVIGRSL